MNQFGFILSKMASVFRLHDYFNVCRGTKVRPHKTNLWIVFHACPFMQIQFGKAILIFMSIIIFIASHGVHVQNNDLSELYCCFLEQGEKICQAIGDVNIYIIFQLNLVSVPRPYIMAPYW